ncbi:MAG: glycoside hydrolase family 15 protein, partial [Nitriliruptorales bacterium]|nr:glycoside hydrolase family 15 protein [Nitriliruptorales bacterium]
GPDGFVVDADIELAQHQQSTVGDLVLEQGGSRTIVLTHFLSHDGPPAPLERPGQVVDDTVHRWGEWVGQLEFDGEYPEAVERSALVIKSMTFRDTGGIVTSPTTSLPENLGGSRNWDYRYCWLRDSALAMYSMMLGGFEQEARSWRGWLLRACTATAERLQPLFGPAGERRIHELTAGWLPGYEGSVPVRIGNGAARQFQLDAFGEVVDALYAADKLGLEPDDEAWALQRDVAAFLQEHWTHPDKGIWELRGPERQYTHSKLMAWVAMDRVIRSVDEFGRNVEDHVLNDWLDLREQMRQEIEKRAWNDDVAAFVQVYGGEALDASLLLMPQTGFLPPDDDRVVATIEAIQRELVRDGWVWRYDSTVVDDGLEEEEGAFIACQCWLADALLLLGRRDEAIELFERVLSVSNDLGLLAEEYDPTHRRQVGNYPLSLTHLAVSNTARNLAGEGPAHHRAGL